MMHLIEWFTVIFLWLPKRVPVQAFQSPLPHWLLATQSSTSLSSSVRRVILSATPVAREEEATTVSGFECEFCHTPFDSRNAMFRHLRADKCSSECPCPPRNSTDDPIVKQSLAIAFGYIDCESTPLFPNNSSTTTDATIRSAPPLNEWAGEQVLQRVQAILDDEPELDFRLQPSRTQSSLARLRARILQQDPDCAAARDVLVLTGTCLQSTLPKLEHILEKQLWTRPSRIELNTTMTTHIWLCKLLNPKLKLHAERSCSQLIYHYLVPLTWLPDGDLLQTQWKGWNATPPTESFKHFKAALRHAESPMSDGSVLQNINNKLTGGRFGRLGAKERRAWHNFADPSSRGKASPNQEPIWRVVDACRMVKMVHLGQDDAAIVVEIKGDAFLPQQVRRIIATALAMTHSWVTCSNRSSRGTPNDLWKTTFLNPEFILETVLAPPGRLYLADCRFHYAESFSKGVPLFDSDISGKVLSSMDALGSEKSHMYEDSSDPNGGDNVLPANNQWVINNLLDQRSSPEIREAEKQ